MARKRQGKHKRTAKASRETDTRKGGKRQRKDRMKESTREPVESSPPIPTFTEVVERDNRFLNRWSAWVIAFLVTFSVAAGVRWHDVSTWNQRYKKEFFVEQRRPIFTGYDAFLHARKARDIAQGRFTGRETLRAVAGKYAYWEDGWDTSLKAPEKESGLPPAISLAGAIATKFTSLPYEWVFSLFPIFVGSLIVVGFLLWGSLLGGVYTGVGAALLGVMSNQYYYRTKLGWFDTDALNFTFTLLVTYLLARMLISKDRNRGFVWAVAAGLVFFLFSWWWGAGNAFLLPFLGAGILVALLAEPGRWKERLAQAAVVYLCYSALWLVFTGSLHVVLTPLQAFASRFKVYYVSVKHVAAEGGAFPSISRSISELTPENLSSVYDRTWGSAAIFWLCTIGALAMGIREWRKAFLLAPIAVLGLWCFRSGARFVPFLTLVLSLGGGYLAYLSYEGVARFFKGKTLGVSRFAAPIVLSAALVWIPAKRDYLYLPTPIALSPIPTAFHRLKSVAPKNAAVWTWWDYGYLIQYWGGLGTLGDGGTQLGPTSYFLALGMATPDPVFGARLMRFYTTRGLQQSVGTLESVTGSEKKAVSLLKDAIKAGPAGLKGVLKRFGVGWSKGWEEFFFPQNAIPVYLAYTKDMIAKAGWWYYFGTWDMNRENGTKPAIFQADCSLRRPGIYQCTRNSKLSTVAGVLELNGRTIPLAEVTTVIANRPEARPYPAYARSRLKAVIQQYGANRWRLVVVSKDFYNSIFVKMFLSNIYDRRAFEPVIVWNPYIQIWKVKDPDRYVTQRADLAPPPLRTSIPPREALPR